MKDYIPLIKVSQPVYEKYIAKVKKNGGRQRGRYSCIGKMTSNILEDALNKVMEDESLFNKYFVDSNFA